MAGYKETPRQKMIAMMYLVLTSLLALNVSKEIIDTFIIMNESMETTTRTFTNKMDNTYSKFSQQYSLNPNKVGPFWNQAQEVQKLSNELIDYINTIKYEVIITTDAKINTVEEAKNTPLDEISSKDRFTEPTRYFFGRSRTGEEGVAGDLKRKLIEYRTKLLQYMGLPSDSDRLGLITEGDFRDADKKKQTWEQHYFYYTVLAADVAILNRLITEVKNAEFDVVSHIYSEVTAEDFKFDQISAKVIANSRYIFEGDKYEAEVIVAAYDTKQNPAVYYMEGVDTIRSIENARQVDGEAGVVKLSIPAGAAGLKKYAGIVQVMDPSGIPQNYSFKDEYIVAKPSLTVSATKMNVFYIGVDNPVSISVPGISNDLISPRINVGSLTPASAGNNYNYVVRIPKGSTGKAVISVDADYGGQNINMGSSEFRIKRVPDPKAFIANVNDGPVSKNAIVAAGAIIPRPPEDFEFDLSFVITSFTFVSVRSGDIFSSAARGNQLTQEMKTFISNAKRGTKVWLENIIAEGPDGNRRLGTITLVLE
jgi:gliding motility-associated protein GldM